MAKVIETAGTAAIRTSEVEATSPKAQAELQVKTPVGAIISPQASPEEIDEDAEARATWPGQKKRPKPLRFFPHIFPVPAQLYGIVTIIAGTLLLGALFYGVRDIMSPFLLALTAGLLFYPFRSEPKIRPLIVSAGLVLILWFIFRASSVLVPLVMAFILAYVIEPVVTGLQRKFYIKRWILALAATMIVIAMIALFLGYMVPVIFEQVGTSLGALDRVGKYVGDWARSGGLTELTGIPQEKATLMVETYLLPKLQGMDGMLYSQAEKAGDALPGLLSALYHFLMIPFLAFYFIKDYWHIRASIYSFIPQEYQRRSQHFLKDMDEVVGGYLRGDLITSVFQGTFIGIGLHFIGVPNALLLGVLTGLLCLIPFIGGIVAFFLAMIAGMTTPDPGITMLYIAGLFLVQGILEATIIGPQVMGRHTDLHPLLVIVSLIIFGYFMGVTGMLIAIPVTGMALRNANRWRDRKQAQIEEEKQQADLQDNPHHATKAEIAEIAEVERIAAVESGGAPEEAPKVDGVVTAE